MTGPAWLEARWRDISTQVHIDRVYIETHRDTLLADDAALEAAKKFFRDRGAHAGRSPPYAKGW